MWYSRENTCLPIPPWQFDFEVSYQRLTIILVYLSAVRSQCLQAPSLFPVLHLRFIFPLFFFFFFQMWYSQCPVQKFPFGLVYKIRSSEKIPKRESRASCYLIWFLSHRLQAVTTELRWGGIMNERWRWSGRYRKLERRWQATDEQDKV